MVLGALPHPKHGGVTPLAGWWHPQSLPVQRPLQRDTKEVLRCVPHRSFVLCLLAGSRTATVSMVSARPVPVGAVKPPRSPFSPIPESSCRAHTAKDPAEGTAPSRRHQHQPEHRHRDGPKGGTTAQLCPA